MQRSGSLMYKYGAYNPKKILHSIISSFQVMASAKDLDLYGLFDKNIPDIVFGDEFRTTQVITNLVSNSIKC